MGNQILRPGNQIVTKPPKKNKPAKPSVPVVVPNPVRKAVLIAINYTGTENELNGCINDSKHLKEFLLENKYLQENEITMMNDEQKGGMYPTKANIIEQFKELVKFANEQEGKNVLLFVSYSGHGYYLQDYNGDESDGRDEVLCPVDCTVNGFIKDDDLKKNLIDQLNPNVNLVFMSDSCHSGTVLDLKYMYKCDKRNKSISDRHSKKTKCNVVLVSGCMDKQTSSDAYLPNKDNNYLYQGAMTASFIKTYKDEISSYDLIKGMQKWIKANKFSQIPQLSSGKKINTKEPFLLSSYNN